MFQHLAPYAGDPILSLVETFKRDPRAHKINLSIGIYFDNDGNMTQPESVQTAEARVGIGAKAYLPMEGHAGLRAELPKLLFGANHRVIAEQRVTTVQTLGGSGALRLGADLLHNAFGNSKVLMSDPTWDNHRGIFTAAGFELGSYPYYDPATIGVKFAPMCECLNRQPENTITASDDDRRMISAAQANAAAAEVENIIQFNVLDAQDTRPNGANGILVANPPYGVRLAEIQALHALYPQLGSWLKQHYAGWTAGLLSGDMEMPKLMRLKPKRKIPLFNGNLDCRLFLFDMVAGSNRKE